MHDSDNLYLSKFLINYDYDSFFEEDNFQDFEFSGEMHHFLDTADLDETDEFFRE